MGESELGMFIYQYDTPMCEEAIERLRKTGLFEDEDLDSLGGRFCYEIARPAVLGWAWSLMMFIGLLTKRVV